MRRYEAEVLEYCYEDIKPTLGMDYILRQTKTDEITCKGKYKMQFHCIDSLGRGDITMKWIDKRKTELG